MRPFLLLLALAACTTDPTTGRWAGTTTSGNPASRPVLSARTGRVLFIPNEGTLVLPGTLAPDGAIHAELTLPGVAKSGGKKQPYRLAFDAKLDQNHVRGTYTTPNCTAQVDLAPL